MANEVGRFTLNDGGTIPVIGYGTVYMKGESGAESIRNAINNGYRLIDTAMKYENEGSVGEGIRRSGIERDELYVTTKLRGSFYDYDEAIQAVEESLFRMQLDYFDLILLHWPNPKQDMYVEAWRALIEAEEQGYVKSIGVSNFLPEHIERLIDETSVLPTVNQIELHPYFSQQEMHAWNQKNDIITQGWSPLSRGQTVVHDDTIRKIADDKDKTVAQIILRWHIQQGVVPIPKAAGENHQKENLDIFNFELTAEEMDQINGLTKDDGRIGNQDPIEYEEF